MKIVAYNGFAEGEEFYRYLRDTLDYLHAEGGRMMSIGLHGRIAGRPGRTNAMAILLRHAPETVRYGVGECLYGYEEIAALRKGRGGSPQRDLGKVAISAYGDSMATANAEFFRENTKVRGRQSQTWGKFEDGWKVVSAHVSLEKDVS